MPAVASAHAIATAAVQTASLGIVTSIGSGVRSTSLARRARLDRAPPEIGNTVVVDDLEVRLQPLVDRHRDLPRPAEGLGILEGRLVVHVRRVDRREALDD